MNAYTQLLDSAQRSTDRGYIEGVIKTIKEKYIQGTPKIASIYYNVATLYHKIGLNDEAVEVMKEDKSQSGGFYLATLLMRIGRTQDARTLLQGFQADLMAKLANEQLDINARSSIVETVFVLAVFLDEDTSSIAKDIVDKGWLPKDTVEEIRARNNVSKTTVLADMWPESVIR